MNVLLIGGGGREHALAWKLAQSPLLARLYAPSSNPGLLSMAQPAIFQGGDAGAVADFCQTKSVDLVIIGPEGPLAAGLADTLRANGIAVFGPSREAAMLEASKSFTKQICLENGIPTAAYASFTERAAALAYVAKTGTPLVVKADGLAAGKGVTVCETVDETLAAIEVCFASRWGGVVLEEKLVGEEVSVFAICDGVRAVPFGSAHDHKRAFDGDTGPNTGGMGATSPSPSTSSAFEREILDIFFTPTLHAMTKRGTPFQGVLYAGLMLTADGPKLIEYNVRFGDPECQVLMLRLRSDLLPILKAAADGDLNGINVEWSDDAAIAVVVAARGYPGAFVKGDAIGGIGEAGSIDGVTVFHAGTRRNEAGTVIADGGRVLNVCATGKTLFEARKKAYDGVSRIDWPGGFYRSDIGPKHR